MNHPQPNAQRSTPTASHNFELTLPTEVNIISDRRGRTWALDLPIKVKRGWPAQVVAQCRCGCRLYRVSVMDIIDVILPVDVLRTPRSPEAA